MHHSGNGPISTTLLPSPTIPPPPPILPSNNLREHYDFPYSQSKLAAFNQNEGQNAGKWRIDDLIVFIALESLGTLAITLNVCLCIVLLRHKYLHRASFVLMLSLALADVLHGLVTTSFFYPPILLRQSLVPSIGVRLFNILDWTAWSITLTHMSAICLDRLLAIIMYGRYNQVITVDRARIFTLTCWSTFFALNTGYILAQFCCLITPLRESHFYTFGYGEFESEEQKMIAPFSGANIFKLTYTPLELATIAVLSISNPITLIQLYRRHKRKMALRIQRSSPPMGVGDAMLRSPLALELLQTDRRGESRPLGTLTASTMLLEVSMRMGSKHVNNEVQQVASRRASRQQQRILLQISVVAIIFYLYMSAYYLLYHVLNVSNKWVVLFNSFFYSTTHMINPVIYFSLNKDMRVQLIRAIADFLNWICCVGNAGVGMQSSIYGRKRAESSSGSGLRKSSPGEQTSTAQGNSGWTLRTYKLPSANGPSPWLLSPGGRRPNEKTPLLRVPSAPPPSTASSSFMLAETAATISAQINDPNNNQPLNNNNNNRIGNREEEEMMEINVENEKEMVNIGMPSKCSEQQSQPLLTILDKEMSSNLMEEDEAMNVEEEEEGIIELELVENCSVEGESEMERKKGWEKRVEEMDGLNRLRNLGSFLAEQLTNEAEKQDRAWANARRQRHSILDALIRALVETGDGILGNNKKNNGQLLGLEVEDGNGWGNVPRKKSRSFDFGHKSQQGKGMVANGWPGMGTKIKNRSNAEIHPPNLSSSSMDISNGGMMVRYNLLKESHSILLENGPNKKEGRKEEEEEEENLDEVIFL